MRILTNIRECIWPLLEKVQINNPALYTIDQISVTDDRLKETLDLAIKVYEREDERRKTVEAKSSLFIGIISVVISVTIGATSILFKENDFSCSLFILVCILTLITIYMSRAVWFSIKTLERDSYHAISPDTFLLSDTDKLYYKKLILEIINMTQLNAITINKKVDNMTMSQEYFKKAVVTVTLYSFAILLLYFLKFYGILEDFECLN